MKILSLGLLMLICLGLCSACGQDQKEDYLYEYGEVGLILTDQPNGIYILESPVKAKWSDGFVEIYACYYDSMGAINLFAYVETSDPERLEEMANDEEHSIYCTVKANGRQLNLSSFGYMPRYENENLGMKRYELKMGYACSLKSINRPLEVGFQGMTLEVPLVQKQAYSRHSQEGEDLWMKYQEKTD